jgi:hypothetical protein
VLWHEDITGIIVLMGYCTAVPLTMNFPAGNPHAVAPGTPGLARVRP